MTKLSPVVVRVVQKNAEVLQEFGIAELPSDIQFTASRALEAIVQSVEAKADDIVEDTDQLRAIWFRFINEDAAKLLNDEAIELVEQIGSQEVRDLLMLIVPAVVATLKEVTDQEDDDNKEEVEKIWVELVKDPVFFARVFSLVKLLF